MRAGSTRTDRDFDRENWERQRYSFLEGLYLLTGENCEHPVLPGQLEAELDLSAATSTQIIDELVRLGYVQYVRAAGAMCVTEKGIRYLQRDAWRRRSVRD